MTTFVNTDLEIEEALDELDEEEMTPSDEGVSELIDDLKLSEDWFYSVEEDQDPVEEVQDPVEEAQDPVEEEQDPVEGISFAEKRERLCEFFSERLKDGSWTFQNPMPRKGKDETFDELVVQLGLQMNRTYASNQWRNFRLDKGFARPPSFDVDASRLLKGYRLLFESYTVEKVVVETLAEIATFKFPPQTVPAEDRYHFLSYAHSLPLKTKLVDLLWKMTEMLASSIAGATSKTIEDKAMKVEMYLLVESEQAFTAFVRKNIDMTGFTVLSADKTPVSTYLFFIELHKCLVKQWRRVLRGSTPTTFVLDLDPYDVHECIAEGSMGTLYYVSGWLLSRLNKTKKGQVHSDNALRQQFVSANSLSTVQANSAPFAVIDGSRPQISHQQLTRSGEAWFSFVSLLEALYIVNLTEQNAMKHRAHLFLELGKALRKSVSLHDNFADCFPITFCKDDRKKMWRMYFVELLPPYAMMKSSDILRGLRAMRMPNDTNRLSTRSMVVVANAAAASKPK
jgi:hypothetical protein